MLGQRRRVAARRRPDRGAVAVEFALVFPLLAMLVLGGITAGLAYSHGIGVTNAVREGARFGATTAYPPASGNWGADVIARTRALQFDDPSSETRVCVDLFKQGTGSLVQTCSGPAALGSPTVMTAPAGTPSNTCVVRVWAARTYTINAILVVFKDKVMTRQSVAVYERNPCG